MRVLIFPVLALATLLAACDGSTSTTNNAGGGGAGGDTASGGGGSSSSTTSDTSSTTSDTMTTSTSDTTTTSSTSASNGCEDAGSDPVSFANDVQPIFSQSCGTSTTCHLKSSPSEGLSLKVGQAYASLVDVPAKQNCNGQDRVEPGSAAGSYLVNKITATDICPGEMKMPPGSNLATDKRQAIIDWICQGAQNN